MSFLDADPRWTYQAVSDTVRKRSGWMEVLGVLFVLLGILALFFVVASSLVSTLMIGWLLLVAGVSEIAVTIGYWRQRRGGFTLGIFLGSLCTIAGLLCLTNPVRSMEVITFTLAIYFIGSGIVRLPMTVTERFPGWGWGVLAAVADIVLGILILAWWPAASLMVLGTLLGIQLIVSGTSAFFSGMTVRRLLEPRPEPAPGRPATRFQH
jgi:uncharacterized membrane protein HdeD (DUF308 family)